eukprot:CAMPEP_0178416926 /NCGR_PEP_ID=MMETSP0689_2-20121128/24314_1 /TAXON_ID=160604 /ORGANISM="Amphidinium massartii, Strain CS-259" /LENGTH=478 /DNA_ID=CAMNT_0020038283 /DNA_START=108 /DNA_END=1544 /DNA_ORIENTATION=+
MAATTDTTSRTLKVTKGDDTRRLVVSWPSEATAEESLIAIQETVLAGFNLSVSTADLILKYADDEGDMCTLTSVGVKDLLTLVPEGAIKLQLEVRQAQMDKPATDLNKDGPAVAAASATAPPSGAAAASTSSSGSAAAAEGASASASAGSTAPNYAPAGAFFATMAMPFLPMAAAAANKPDHRASGNRAGVSKREALLPVATKLLENLNRVPETVALRPALQQYVDGSDPDHFGDIAADILQAWVASPSKNEVREVLEVCLGDIMPILPLLGRGDSQEDEDTADCFREMDSFFKNFGGNAQGCSSNSSSTAGTGTASASATAGSSAGNAGMPSNPENPLAGLLQGLFAANGLGQKGSGRGNEPDFAQGLNNLFQGLGKGFGNGFGPFGKGFGKGKGGQQAWGNGSGFGPCAPGFMPPQQQQQQASTADDAPGPSSDEDMKQKVAELLEMGLVSDPEVAEDLLRSHGGDVAAVVNTLTA